MKSTTLEDSQGKFKEGQVVYAKKEPSLMLVVRRYVSQIYYCKVQEDLERKELVYFERDLLPKGV